VNEGLNSFATMVAQAARETPQAFLLQGSPKNSIVLQRDGAVPQRGDERRDLTLDEAIAAITEEVDKNANN
jgi:alpha-1,4-digalacturonate transport system substrate-binding protein